MEHQEQIEVDGIVYLLTWRERGCTARRGPGDYAAMSWGLGSDDLSILTDTLSGAGPDGKPVEFAEARKHKERVSQALRRLAP